LWSQPEPRPWRSAGNLRRDVMRRSCCASFALVSGADGVRSASGWLPHYGGTLRRDAGGGPNVDPADWPADPLDAAARARSRRWFETRWRSTTPGACGPAWPRVADGRDDAAVAHPVAPNVSCTTARSSPPPPRLFTTVHRMDRAAERRGNRH
jgi:hypothetical protein